MTLRLRFALAGIGAAIGVHPAHSQGSASPPASACRAYVAATLPQLMLEAGRFDELVLLALSGGALPTELTIARRDVELQRLQFALQAAIRSGGHLDAAKLALKAGGETAADARQQKMLSGNTDLGARFLEPEQMLEQVSRRLIAGGDWTGSDHAFEAAFLSGSPGLSGEARSRLRVSYDWLGQWARNVNDRGTQTRVRVFTNDVAGRSVVLDVGNCAAPGEHGSGSLVARRLQRLLELRLEIGFVDGCSHRGSQHFSPRSVFHR